MKVHRHRARRVRIVPVVCCALAAVASAAFASAAAADTASTASTAAVASNANTVPGNGAFPSFEARSLDGTGNNILHPTAGAAGSSYIRIAPAAYADGISSQRTGSTAPNARYISNRIFNDVGQNIFSERNMNQWAWIWGQFIDHTLGLAKSGTEDDNIATSSSDPLETFRNDRGFVQMTRDAAAAGTGTSRANPRQQVNTTSSFISAFQVYGPTTAREEWLRDGPVDGNLANNAATLMLPGGYLPTGNARGNAATAPTMTLDGFITGNPGAADEAGDVRANENIALTTTQTLFAREHNRIVGLLPNTLTSQQKFEIARRVVGAEEQWITYTQFLPDMGVNLPAYRGYNPNADPDEQTEFATVGYRAHSQIHGEFEVEGTSSTWTAATLDQLEQLGVEVDVDGDDVELTVPLNAAFFNPSIVPLIGEGPLLDGFGDEPEYNNDEQIDNTLRSLLFRVPSPTTLDPSQCFSDPIVADAAGCFQQVQDLGAIDLQRGRDHGIPTYNAVRKAYGLPAKTSFTAITGESSDALPSGSTINTPSILDFVSLKDLNGNPVAIGAKDGAVQGTRRSTLASRLKAVYGNVNNVDAFVGAYSEPHAKGSEMGQTNQAIWSLEFRSARDGDRFFYANDSVLNTIQSDFGITYKHTLEQIINMNSNAGVNAGADVFFQGQG
jgi:Animal haem peroxidase